MSYKIAFVCFALCSLINYPAFAEEPSRQQSIEAMLEYRGLLMSRVAAQMIIEDLGKDRYHDKVKESSNNPDPYSEPIEIISTYDNIAIGHIVTDNLDNNLKFTVKAIHKYMNETMSDAMKSCKKIAVSRLPPRFIKKMVEIHQDTVACVRSDEIVKKYVVWAIQSDNYLVMITLVIPDGHDGDFEGVLSLIAESMSK